MNSFFKYHVKERLKLIYQNIKLTTFNTDDTPILVFTMAKVGSLSVYSSIKKRSNIPIFHVHSLDENEILEGVNTCFEHGIYPSSRSPVPLINREIINKQQPLKIISLFRNPIDRNLSAFFDAFKMYTGVDPIKYNNEVSLLKDIYLDKLPHYYPTKWYEKQFFEGVNFNVYNYNFDKEKEYSVYKGEGVELLMMNCNLDNRIKEDLISNFCNIRNFKLINTNVTSDSKSGALYVNFKKEIKFDKVYLDSLLNTTYFNHFFTNKEKEKTYEKWLMR